MPSLTGTAECQPVSIIDQTLSNWQVRVQVQESHTSRKQAHITVKPVLSMRVVVTGSTIDTSAKPRAQSARFVPPVTQVLRSSSAGVDRPGDLVSGSGRFRVSARQTGTWAGAGAAETAMRRRAGGGGWSRLISAPGSLQTRAADERRCACASPSNDVIRRGTVTDDVTGRVSASLSCELASIWR